MKKIFPFISFLLLSGILCAQDFIYMRNGDEVQAKVVEITPEFIKYKLFDFQDGPLYSMRKSDVFMLVYENGRREKFQQPPSPVTPEPPPAAETMDELRPVKPEVDDLPEEEPIIDAEPVVEPSFEVEMPPKFTEPEGFKSRFRLGFTVGANAATRKFDYAVGANPPSNSYRITPTAGLTFDLELWRKFHLQSSLLYKAKGDRINMGNWSEEYEYPTIGAAVFEVSADGFTSTLLHYGELSFMPIIGFGGEGAQFQVGAGGFVAYGIAGKEKHDYTVSYFLDHELESEEVFDFERDVEFVGLIKDSDDPKKVYYEKIDHGYLFYSGLRFSNVNLGAYLAWGRQQLELDDSDLFVEEKPVAKTTTFTWTLAMTFYL